MISDKLKNKTEKKESKKLNSPISKVLPNKTDKHPAKSKQSTLDQFKIKIPQASSDVQNFPELPKGKELSIYAYNVNGLRATLNKGSLIDFIKKGN